MIKLTDLDNFRETSGATTYTHPDYEGLELVIGYDSDCESPRKELNIGTMSVSYSGYDLGDENIREIDFTTRCTGCGGHGYVESEESGSQCTDCFGSGEHSIDPVEYFRKERGARIVLPLIVYEHSMITMRVGKVGDIMGDAEGWDTSFVGFIYDTPEAIKECWGDSVPTDEQLTELLRGEVETYAHYLEGECYFYRVEDDLSNYYDACHGFIGGKYVEEEAAAAFTRAMAEHDREQTERDYWSDRGIATTRTNA